MTKANLIFAPCEWFTNSRETMKGKVFYNALGQKYTVDYFTISILGVRIYTMENENFVWVYNGNKSILIEKEEPLQRDMAYWQRRCELAEAIIEHTPCDPDVTQEQIVAHSAYNHFILNN